jgi:hypothetical protein
MYGAYRAQVFVTFAIFLVIAALLVAAATDSGPGPQLAAALAWTAGVIISGYWYLRRFPYRIELTATTLRWWTPTHRGELPLDRLRAVRPFRFAPNVAIFEPLEGKRVPVMTRHGFAEFSAEVRAAAAHVNTDCSRYARITGRVPGPSGFRYPPDVK